jgi:hypothetical protein
VKAPARPAPMVTGVKPDVAAKLAAAKAASAKAKKADGGKSDGAKPVRKSGQNIFNLD